MRNIHSSERGGASSPGLKAGDSALALVEAGTEWLGVSHPQAHAHKDNPRLLKQANAPHAVQDAWRTLETLRPGGIYGKETDEAAGAAAQAALQVIKDWGEGVRPHP